METKAKILATMKRLASDRGFHAVTTDELAAACGISKRTLYRYFNSKDEIVEQVLDNLLTEVGTRVQEILAGPLSPPAKLQAMARAVAEGVSFLEPQIFHDLQRHYPHLWEKIDRFRAERMEKLGQVYLEGCQKGYFKEFNVEVVINSFLAAVRAIINPGFFTSHNISLPLALDTLVEIFLCGISKVTPCNEGQEPGRIIPPLAAKVN
ncbi:TetR/AcrR family transcriptional regulator [Moorella sulfitireducens]|uniref:TetR/AcrR family transcriptional regulator n=1 Tax=Neomoorella sulfitireducens TaxID=2972948 RepID=UPI0021AD2CA9|nr:TetR/AcrR family transcriptional regulator [Moorella sulfitireducens]